MYALATIHNFINQFYNGDKDFNQLQLYLVEDRGRANAERINIAGAITAANEVFNAYKIDLRREEIADVMQEDYYKYKVLFPSVKQLFVVQQG